MQTESPADTASDLTFLRTLAAAMHAVQRQADSLAVASIRWMYLKYPRHTIQEALLSIARGEAGCIDRMHKRSALMRFFWRIWEIVRCLGNALLLCGRLAILHWQMTRETALLLQERFDVVGKTCCFGLERLPDGRDFYYGDLQGRLSQHGLKLLLICSDILGKPWLAFARRQVSTAGVYRLPELCLVPVYAPLLMALGQVKAAWQLRGFARKEQRPLFKAVFGAASHACLDPDTAYNGLTYWSAKNSVKRWHPKAFMTFYEGHAWERCAWMGAKAADARCATVAYQHAMLFRESLALTEPFAEGLSGRVPDIILGQGEGSLELMRPGHEKYPVKLLCFGNFRYRSLNESGPADPARKTVLVTPTGLEDEAAAVLEFAAACAEGLPGHQFILRMFPGVSLPAVERRVRSYMSRLTNVSLSTHADIYQDYDRASLILYRGSSAVLHAVFRGLLPVYAQIDPKVDTDPLYMLRSWHRSCRNVSEFVAAVRDQSRLDSVLRQQEWREAADYLGRYAGPVEAQNVDRWLEAIGLKF